MNSRSLQDFLLQGLPTEADKLAYQRVTHAWFDKGEYTRIFNTYNPPIDPTDFQAFKKIFFRTRYMLGMYPRLVEKTTGADGDEYFIFSKVKNQRRVIDFVQEMATKACAELVDHQGHIKREIVYLLGWGKYLAQTRNRDVVMKIVRSYMEAIVGSLLQALLQDKAVMQACPPEDLLLLQAAVTRVATLYYASCILLGMQAQMQIDALDEYAKRWVAALPDSLISLNLPQLLEQDLSWSQRLPSLQHAYKVFWLHVLTECLAVGRFDVIAVVKLDLPKFINEAKLDEKLKNEYAFCWRAVRELPAFAFSARVKTTAASSESPDAVIAQRDEWVVLHVLSENYARSSVVERELVGTRILTQLNQQKDDASGQLLSLLDRLRRAVSECMIYGVSASALAKELQQYVTFFATRVDLMPSPASVNAAPHSDAKTIQQVGLISQSATAVKVVTPPDSPVTSPKLFRSDSK